MKTMLKNLGYTDFRFGLSNVSKKKKDYREMLEIKFKESEQTKERQHKRPTKRLQKN